MKSALLLIVPVALLVSGLTFFSGFGLGTLLMPAFALFFPLQSAIAMTAMVHLLNNIFKLILIGRYADKKVVLAFGGPAVVAAAGGASLLVWLGNMSPVFRYTFFGHALAVTPLDMTIAVVIGLFAVMDLFGWMPPLKKNVLALPLGGVLSGFFGGLSGHQGALRSAVLIKFDLSKEAFIASGVLIAVLIDISRLFIYTTRFDPTLYRDNVPLLLAAILSAFSGAFIGRRLLRKVTIRSVRYIVAFSLLTIAMLIGCGII
ncbi:MAG: sulfite exporter TauE/SafE family protein [Calditrichaeota bacterium]|nr:MAG: sulfite exporter TauE/SafE family protein [Calditrichota bacterium]